jgi:hypothetical protein
MDSGLERRLESHFRSEAERFALDAEWLKTERVLNWGGFGTYSFRVSDSNRSLHVKLAAEQADLRRWMTVHERLEREYRAPRIIGWVDISGTAYAGPVFEHIDGDTWDTNARPGLVCELRELLGRLHRDQELADQIGDAPKSFLECWRLRYRDQFVEDLKTVRGTRPESVTDDRLRWMEQESRIVLAMPDGIEAFEGMTRSQCHWDLWPNNVMVEKSGEWWVLDWDSLAVGDEAEDFATLVWPLVNSQNEDWRTLLGGDWDGSFAVRMDMHLRAITLDYVIDVLADWAECDVPEWRDEVRLRKEAEHHRYFEWYRSRWG